MKKFELKSQFKPAGDPNTTALRASYGARCGDTVFSKLYEQI